MLALVPMFDTGNSSITYEQFPASNSSWRQVPMPFDSALLLEAGLRQRLLDLGRLSSAWDGEAALPLSTRTLTNARNVALLLLKHTRLPEIVPNPGDTVTLEWERDNGMALLEIGHDSYSFLLKTASGNRVTDTGRLGQEADLAAIGSRIQRTLFGELTA